MTAADAVHRGHLVITLPCLGLIFGTPLIVSIVLIANGVFESILLYAAIGFVVGILLAIVYGAFAETKWRIWAFTNVEDIHELERKAIETRLIYPRGHRLAKWIIASREEKKKLAQIEGRLQAPNISKQPLFIDDPTVPPETIIYYAKWSNLFMVLIGFACMVIGIEVWGNRGNLVVGLLLILLGGRRGWKAFSRLSDRNPQIIVNDEGIQVRNLQFHAWENIQDEEIGVQGFGEYAYSIFAYNYGKKRKKRLDGKYVIPIGTYNISARQLQHLLEIYRGRYNAK